MSCVRIRRGVSRRCCKEELLVAFREMESEMGNVSLELDGGKRTDGEVSMLQKMVEQSLEWSSVARTQSQNSLESR